MTKNTEDTNDKRNGPARAVLYLRVSTKEQAERGGKVEGFSIPAQRQACERQARHLHATIVDEFVDRGESAKTSKRPELKRMLQFLKDDAVQYVIVHKIDRLARNRADDVEINLAIRAAGATLVSCSENIDETPSGMLMHGIMSSIAEFYSRNLANEVIKGTVQKARSGGTVGKAPTGYLNVREMVERRENRTVAIDPERGPLVRWAFEQYATGEWSVRRLLDEVTERGLTSSGGPNTPSKPLSVSNFNRLLKNDYYVGVVTYQGVKYDGNHEPLISRDLFDQVQRHLAAKNQAGEKRRKHLHYLNGSVICQTCESRMVVHITKNRHGTIYPYFACLGRHEKRTDCRQKNVLIGEVEAAIVEDYARHSLSPEERAALEQFIEFEMSVKMGSQAEEEIDRQTTRIQRLRNERKKLLQAHYADAISIEQLKSEQDRITTEMSAAEKLLAQATVQQEHLLDAVSQALDMVEQCHKRYVDAPPQIRREMNQSLFQHFTVGPNGVVQAERRPEIELLLHEDVKAAAGISSTGPWFRGGPLHLVEGVVVASSDVEELRDDDEGDGHAKTLSFAGQGSRMDYLVRRGGLEPPRPKAPGPKPGASANSATSA